MSRDTHAVLVRLRLSDNDLGTEADEKLVEYIECPIRAALDESPGLGVWDGHEFGGGRAVIFCYGHDGSILRETIEESYSR